MEGVTLWDVSGGESRVEITGSDAFRFTSLLTPRNLRKRGRDIGKVTSACWSLRREKNIGFAMVPTDLGEIGIEIEVCRSEATVDAVVADRVFFTPEHAEQPTADHGRGTTALRAPPWRGPLPGHW